MEHVSFQPCFGQGPNGNFGRLGYQPSSYSNVGLNMGDSEKVQRGLLSKQKRAACWFGGLAQIFTWWCFKKQRDANLGPQQVSHWKFRCESETKQDGVHVGVLFVVHFTGATLIPPRVLRMLNTAAKTARELTGRSVMTGDQLRVCVRTALIGS